MKNNIYTENVVIREFKKCDVAVFEEWLYKDYIKQWFGDPKEWLDEVNNDDGKFDWINHFIVEYDSAPIGFCQYFDCKNAPEGFGWEKEPPGTFSIDYLIGEEAFLRKGIGSVIIQKLIALITARENPKSIIADPVKENKDSIKLLEKNGFTFDETSGFHKIAILM